jgi:hypothetical protein
LWLVHEVRDRYDVFLGVPRKDTGNRGIVCQRGTL